MNSVSATPNLDTSAIVLATALRAQLPFYFIKLGDGAIECIHGYGSGTCDGELYTKALGKDLLDACISLTNKHEQQLYVGDWRTASFSGPKDRSRYNAQYESLIDFAYTPKLLSFECLLLMRESDALLDFYRALRDDQRRKLLMGPGAWRPIAETLDCEFFEVPLMQDLHSLRGWMSNRLKLKNFEVLLYGAGLAGHVAVIDCWKAFPKRTYINLGSALDPLTERGRTRKQQLSPERACAFFNRLRVNETVIATAGRGNSLLRGYEAANERARSMNGGRCENGHARGQRGCILCEDLL